MNTAAIQATSLEVPLIGRPQVPDRRTFEMVKPFATRIFSIAKHITQNDEDAEDVLMEAFLQAYPDSSECGTDENTWLRLVTIAVREAFSKLRNRADGRPPFEQSADSYEDLVIREFLVWGGHGQQSDCPEPANYVLEQGIRSLDPMCRAVFLLRDIEEIPVEHIARIVSRSVAAVEVCLLRARLQLREMLAQHMKKVH